MVNKEEIQETIEKQLILNKISEIVANNITITSNEDHQDLIEKCGKGSKSYIASQLNKHTQKLETLLQDLAPLSDNMLDWIERHDVDSGFEFQDDEERWGDMFYSGKQMQKRELQFVKGYVNSISGNFSRLLEDAQFLNEKIDVFKNEDWDSERGKQFLEVYLDYHSLQKQLSNGGMLLQVESNKDNLKYILPFSDDPNFNYNPYYNTVAKIIKFNRKSLNYNTNDMETYLPLTENDLHPIGNMDEVLIGSSDE